MRESQGGNPIGKALVKINQQLHVDLITMSK